VRAARRLIGVAAVAATAICSAGCGGAAEHASSEAFAASEAITFTTPDGVQLAGRLFGPSEAPEQAAGIVLAHMLPADQSSWYDEAIRLSDAGYLVLTFNFRGYCPGGDAGCSKGTKQPDAAAVDLAAAVEQLRSLGVSRIGLVGASMGGTASLVVASDEPSTIRSVITLSAPSTIGSLSAGPDVLVQVTAASLFIAGTGDPTAAEAAQAFYDAAGQPKRLEIVASDDHGTDMLTGNAGGRIRDLIDLWLGTYLPPQSSSVASPSA
jgi:dienelactone hydrolase